MRESGILLHISSLPSEYGIGDLNAFKFVDFLVKSGQKVWQILPINPTDIAVANSPYYSYSAYAGNILFISPKLLVDDGFLKKEDIYLKLKFSDEKVNYKEVTEYKEKIFEIAYNRFKKIISSSNFSNYLYDYNEFCIENSNWLEDFALFTAIKKSNFLSLDGTYKCENSLKEKRTRLIEKEKFLQYLFFKQWDLLKNYCKKRGIRIIGDMQIYVIQDSVEVWKNPKIFKLDKDNNPSFVAGVPPDYFSKTGQYWGNIVYDWDALKKQGYKFWIDRIAHNLKLFDLIRIDHFRGFIEYWEIPANEKTAINGKWVKAQPFEFFNTILKKFPITSFIAEDLGSLTQEVIETINKFNFSGMKVLLFAFDEDCSKNPHIPYNHIKNCVVYTGTHDNNTVRGWFEKEASDEDKKRFFEFIGKEVPTNEIHWEFVRLALSSVANLSIIPMQDIIGADDTSRMNLPATIKGNWEWRVLEKQLTNEISLKLSKMTRIYGRC